MTDEWLEKAVASQAMIAKAFAADFNRGYWAAVLDLRSLGVTAEEAHKAVIAILNNE